MTVEGYCLSADFAKGRIIYETHSKINELVSEDDDLKREILNFRNPESYNDLLAWREQYFGFKFK